MRSARTIGLLGAMVIFLALASSSSSATTITFPGGTSYTGEITGESEGGIIVDRSGLPPVKCEASTLRWKNESHGAAVTAKGAVTEFGLECAELSILPVSSRSGTIEVHKGNGLPGNYDTLTWTGAEFFFAYLPFGPNCIYRIPSGGIKLGLLTGSTLTGGAATIDMDANRLVSQNIGCPSEARLTGSYAISFPGTLNVD